MEWPHTICGNDVLTSRPIRTIVSKRRVFLSAFLYVLSSLTFFYQLYGAYLSSARIHRICRLLLEKPIILTYSDTILPQWILDHDVLWKRPMDSPVQTDYWSNSDIIHGTVNTIRNIYYNSSDNHLHNYDRTMLATYLSAAPSTELSSTALSWRPSTRGSLVLLI